MSEKQLPKYYEWNGTYIRGRGKKIPVTWFKPTDEIILHTKIENLKDNYAIGVFKNNKFLHTIKDSALLPDEATMVRDKDKGIRYRLCIKKRNFWEVILCNPKIAGTPRYYLINGQDIYNGRLKEHFKGLVMDKIKECYLPHVEKMPVINGYPIRITCEVQEVIFNPYGNEGNNWDIDNLAYPYMKAFPDLLVKLGKITNDDRLHITQPPSPIFVPIENHEERKLIFIIDKDDREVIKNNKTYASYSYESEDTKLIKETKEETDEIF